MEGNGERAAAASGDLSELIDRGDVNELLFHVGTLVSDRAWDQLSTLRELCLRAFQRGKQLWAVSAYIEYRLCLEGPGQWAGLMLEAGSGRFSLGPLPEVAACNHTWAELAPYLHPSPEAAMAAHERVMRGEDLSADPLATTLPDVLDLPLRLQAWEPSYALADYHDASVDVPPPRLPALTPCAPASPPGAPGGRGQGPTLPVGRQRSRDEVCEALEELVSIWTAQSNGRAEAAAATGGAAAAIAVLGAPLTEMCPLAPAEALALMAWAGSDGGAHGHRRGAAPGRFAAWWALAAIGDLTAQWPVPADRLGDVLNGARWYRWGSGEPDMGWTLRLAVEAPPGPSAGRAWAVSASDGA